MTRHIATPYSGVTIGDLHDLLRQNRYRVDPPYWGRLIGLIAAAPLNSLRAAIEQRRYAESIREAKIRPPLFVLGHWRSGTTFLHNLLSVDTRFAFPTTYQVVYPRGFLDGEKLHRRLMNIFVPAQRPMDNMALGMDLPQEDEFAMLVMTRLSFFMTWVYPKREREFEKYLTFEGVPDADLARWKSALVRFMKKLSYRYEKPLVLKSPPHTARIRLLLELFPDARFVHIRRNPFDVFRSTCHMTLRAGQTGALQRRQANTLGEGVLRRYRSLYDAYFQQVPLIPKGRLCEICYEELESDPVGQVKRVYEELSLPTFGEVRATLVRYVDSLAGYTKNPSQPLPSDVRAQIVDSGRMCFERWGYPTT